MNVIKDLCGAVGCSATLAIILTAPLIVTIAVAQFFTSGDAGTSFLIACLFAGAVFFASLLLCARDRIRSVAAEEQDAAQRILRTQRLLARDDVSIEDFRRCFPKNDASLVSDLRDAIALFLNVPPTKIYPDDRPADYDLENFEPDLLYAVGLHILSRRDVPQGLVRFSTTDVQSINHLADEMETMIAGLRRQK